MRPRNEKGRFYDVLFGKLLQQSSFWANREGCLLRADRVPKMVEVKQKMVFFFERACGKI